MDQTRLRWQEIVQIVLVAVTFLLLGLTKYTIVSPHWAVTSFGLWAVGAVLFTRRVR